MEGLFRTTREKRAINRTIVDFASIMRSMNHPESKKYRIKQSFGKMIALRTEHKTLHPNGSQTILFLWPSIFTSVRKPPAGEDLVVTLANVTQSRCTLEVPFGEIGKLETSWLDLLSEREFRPVEARISVPLEPYDVA